MCYWLALALVNWKQTTMPLRLMYEYGSPCICEGVPAPPPMALNLCGPTVPIR
jgi:hypothetical protein